MSKQRVIIQDMNKPYMPEVTGMIVTGVRAVGGDMLRFEHPDDSVTIINIAPGWNVTISAYEEDVM